jgi:hypothetical protein
MQQEKMQEETTAPGGNPRRNQVVRALAKRS